MSLLMPVEPEQSEYPGVDLVPCNSHAIYGSGDVKTAIIARPDIGKFVAEIISDERHVKPLRILLGRREVAKRDVGGRSEGEAELGRRVEHLPKDSIQQGGHRAELEEREQHGCARQGIYV